MQPLSTRCSLKKNRITNEFFRISMPRQLDRILGSGYAPNGTPGRQVPLGPWRQELLVRLKETTVATTSAGMGLV
jgi:hypothetical protein